MILHLVGLLLFFDEIFAGPRQHGGVGGGRRPTTPISPFGRSTEIHDGWKACRHHPDPSQGCRNEDLLNVTSLPTTALAVLLENQKIPGLEDLSMDDIYFSTNMARVPDIFDVGRDYYTLLYEVTIPPWNDEFGTRQTIRLAGTNYRARAWLDSVPLPELAAHGGAPGMFVRRNFDVTGGGRFSILIEPPDHPGKPNCGQGGE